MELIALIVVLGLGLFAALAVAVVTQRFGIQIDLTPIEHAVAAIMIQSGWAFVAGDWWAGTALGIAVFVGREHAQAEYRYINANGGNRYTTPLPAELACLHPRWWDIGSVLDLVVPVLACLTVAFVVTQ